MEYDFRTDILLIADDFYDAYKRCREGKNPVHFDGAIKYSACNIPAIVNGSFALCIRIPIRIELRIYSAWIIDQKSQSQKFDLITYIASNIANKSNGEFDNETLRKYLATYSWAFFFDGLDEVPESSNRKEVMEEILKFIKIELKQADTDTLLFATTRPEGYVGEFDKNEFIHLDLLPLDYEGCINYLTKLLEAIENDSTKKKEYLDILERAIKNEQIAFMLKTPLQATIMAILVRAGGEPPRDKYSLFKEYFEIIIKREKQKSTETILNSNQELIENVYYLLGYELQKRSSTTDKSDALLTLDELKDLISKKLNKAIYLTLSHIKKQNRGECPDFVS